MKITKVTKTVRELTENYRDDGDGGVYGYNGKLVLRPSYQREFCFRDKQRNEVMIGKISQTYYFLTYSEYMDPKDEFRFKMITHPEYYDYFSRCIITHKGNIMKKRKLKEENI